MEVYPGISYDSALNYYVISLTASQGNIQTVLNVAPSGATVRFASGTFEFDAPLTVARGNIMIKGAPDAEGGTTFRFSSDVTENAFVVKGKADSASVQTLPQDVAAGSKTLTISNASTIKAGDVLYVYQENDAEFLSSGPYDPVEQSPYMADNPLRTSIVEVESVNGNVVTLKHEIAYDMDGGAAKVEKFKPLKGVSVSDLTLTYDGLGTPDPYAFNNALPEFNGHSTFFVSHTDNAKLSNITILNAPSNGLEVRNSLDTRLDGLTVEGAHNKGGEGNGYGLYLGGTSHGVFEHLTVTDVRHAVLFASWSAETSNKVQVDFTNRDINYHGSPDHSNTVIVNEAAYRTDGAQAWALVSPGAADKHPYTDILQNVNLFGRVMGSFKTDTVFGWDDGAFLDGRGGNDKLTGGASADTLVGGDGNDTLTGGGSRDTFLFSLGDDQDTVIDFKAGTSGDVLTISGYGGLSSMADLKIVQSGADTKITLLHSVFVKDSILLKNVDSTKLLSANFSFSGPGEGTSGGGAPPGTLDLTLSSDTDYIRNRGATNDTVTTKISNLSAADVVSLGGGTDTLVMDSDNFTLNTILFGNLSGIDVVDVTRGTSAKIILDQSFLDRTDSGSITIVYDGPGIERLTASGLSTNSRVLLSGNGTVRLADNIDNTVDITSQTLGKILGQRGDDIFRISGPGAVTLDGGSGDDQFVLKSGTLSSATVLRGGTGVDALVFSSATSLSSSALANTSGIEKLVFSKTGNDISLSDALVSSEIEISGTGSSVLSTKIRIDTLTKAASILVGEGISLELSGASDQVHTVRVRDGVNGSITGSSGNDRLLGGTGNDRFLGGDGDDFIEGGAGKDSLRGGSGRDTFNFVRGDGMDNINDFQAGSGGDIVRLESYYHFSSFSDIKAAMTQRDETSVRLKLNQTEYVIFRNQALSAFTSQNFVIDNSKVLALDLHATKSVERLVSSSATDSATVAAGAWNADDLIDLGGGIDTLRLVGGVGTLDFKLGTVRGVEILDATQVTGAARLILSDSLASQHDSDNLILIAGSAGIASLDTSGASRDVVLRGSNTSVSLADGLDNRIIVDPATNLTLNGGSGDDTVRLRGGSVTFNGGDGNDYITVNGAGGFSLYGDTGDDLFLIGTSSFAKGRLISGGEGFDEVRLYQADTFTRADLDGFSGIERFTLAAGVNRFTLDSGLFDQSLTFKSGGGVVELYLDLSYLRADQRILIDSGVLARLDGDSGESYTIETNSATSQPVYGSSGAETFHGGNGNDVLYGNDGADIFYGGYGDDHLYGGSGNDKFYGGRGADIMTGGAGRDTFHYSDRNEGSDVILDFDSSSGGDTLDLQALFDLNGLGGTGFAQALDSGHLSLRQSGSDTIVSFDRDGTRGGSSALVLVTLENVDAGSLGASNILL